MKKLSLLFILVLFMGIQEAFAQIPPIRVHAGLGLAQGTGDFAGDDLNIGFGYTLNVRYMFSDKLDAGIEYNGAAVVTLDIDGADADATGLTSYQLKGYYSFFSSKVTPYAGLGLGLTQVEYPTVTVTDSNGNETVFEGESVTNFGFTPELGLRLGSFTLGAKYTAAGTAPDETTSVTYIQYFLGLTFSFGD